MVFEHARALPLGVTEVNKTGVSGRLSATRGGQNREIERDPFRSNAGPTRHGYIRVSTTAQQVDRQVMQLETDCDVLHLEHVSAVASERPVFDQLISGLKADDTFIVVDLDRAFRSAIDAIQTSQALRERGVRMEIQNFPIDPGSDEGELFYGIVALFAQFERRIISRRTREGMEAARRRGAKIGRPAQLDPQTVVAAHEWITDTGLPCRYVATLLGVSRLTLQRSFKRAGLRYPIEP